MGDFPSVDSSEQIEYSLENDTRLKEKWINGRDIFRKVIPLVPTFITVNGTNIAHGVPINEMINIRLFWLDTTPEWRNLPWDDTAGNRVDFKVGVTNVTSIVTGAGAAAPGFTNGYIIIDYTL